MSSSNSTSFPVVIQSSLEYRVLYFCRYSSMALIRYVVSHSILKSFRKPVKLPSVMASAHWLTLAYFYCHSYYFHLRRCLCHSHCCFPVWSQLSMFWRCVSCLHLCLYRRLWQHHQYLLLRCRRFPSPHLCHGNSWGCSFVAFFSFLSKVVPL
jgi:hypothetical protein